MVDRCGRTYLCGFDLDCKVHSSLDSITVRRLTKDEIKSIGVCRHPDCMKLAEYAVDLH